MLNENTKVVIPDLRNKRDVEMEVCFAEDEVFKDTIKVTMGSEEAIIKIKDLYGFMFVIANAEQQEQLMPVQQTTIRKIVKRHVVKVTKDIRKGDMLNVRCETNVPVEMWEGMKGMMGKRVLEPKQSFNIPLIGVK